jgi:putative heme iron utilization protein
MKDRTDSTGINNGVTPEQRRRIEEAMRANPNQMTLQLARKLDVPEVEVLRAMPAGRAVELDAGRPEELIRAFEGLGKVHVIVSNGCTTCEVVGAFGGFSTWGEFFNVQSKTLDMHIRLGELAAAFAVEKPSHMEAPGTPAPDTTVSLAGTKTTLSIQFYDRRGSAAFKVFLTFGEVVSAERAAKFEDLRERFRLG